MSDHRTQVRLRNRQALLLKRCPLCNGHAEAEAKLPLSSAARPTVFDLDRVGDLAAELSLGQLLALAELIPYKHFSCAQCGHSFQLSSETGKAMVVSMIATMQPVGHMRPAKAVAQARPATARAIDKPDKPARKKPENAPAREASAEWEPESLD